MPSDPKKLALTIAVVPCPNCGGQFHIKADRTNFTNIRCDACGFEALFHSMEGEGKQLAFTIEKDDAERMMSEKRHIPPIILHWGWQEEHTGLRLEVADLFPFIPYTFLRTADAALSLSEQINYTLMFLQGDEELPKMRIYSSPANDDEIAEFVSFWDNINTSRIQRMFNFGYSRAARIVDRANEIRRKKGLSTEQAQEEDEDEE